MVRAKDVSALVAVLLAGAPVPALAQQIRFSLAEQPAVTSIPEFARQAGLQIVSPAGLAGLRTHAVKGRHSIDQALRALLRGTNLYVAVRTATVVSLAIRPLSAPPRPPRTQPPRKAAAPPAPRAKPDPEASPDIVVTGTPSPERRLDAGLAITTASLERIRELAPNNTADVLKLVPGIWAETTGGATGANVFVRGFPTTGDAPFLTVQLDGAPIYPPTELTFSENTTLFRVDDMIDRVEILRGGTSPVVSNGQPGAIMNFIQRTGTQTFGGGLRLSTTDYGTRRADGYLTGPIAPDTVFAVGGFYRTSDGLRNTQYPADRGGQITANVTHAFSNGTATAYVRYTRDRNAFYTGVPLLANGDGTFSALAGFDPLRDTLDGRDTQHLSIEAGPGDLRRVDLAEGRGLDLFLAGVSVDWSPGVRTQITNRFNLTVGNADTVGLFTGSVPETLGQYIADTVARANGDPRVVAAAGTAASGSAVLAATGLPVSSDRYVLTAGLWSVTEKIASFTDELRVSRTIGSGHKISAGLYGSYYHADASELLGNNLLLLVEPNARRIDLTLDNGVKATRDGFVSATTSQVVDTSHSTNLALFLSDTWSVSARTRLDAGVRFERQWLRGSVRNLATIDFDGNPRTLYDNNGALLLATSTVLGTDSNRLSWAIGLVTTAVPERLTLHARLNHGSNLQSFDKLRLGGPRTQSADVLEIGADLVTGPVRASVNGFVNRFTGLQFTRLLAQPDGSVGSILLTGGADAAGIEFETDITPLPRWKLELRGTYESAHYRGFGDNDGNRVVRQPNIQFAVSPVYATQVAGAGVKLSATYTFVGARYSDVENLQRLPAYGTVDAGLHLKWRNGLYADLVVQNLLNAFGLTEGNTRVLGDVLAVGPIVARPLFGRNATLSFGYRF
ncbi:TonB-dependent receptor domain-containing protein [Sphingomonas sp. PAMC 26605]|uniref:TonB-dependent receptor domain-containing protein n=1 Tax=Sphingomonas sp. PAMC 26605 TaxID=1112214 RepID=UPI00026CCBB7|nr:TonB-dependent receptor [Sphingomonas sp. PAMC 26605]